MSTVEQSVEVNLPIAEVYGQWTQFEEFPQFMSGVESITQVDDTHLHWVASIEGVHREWDAEVTEQHPEERVAWKATSGVENAGVVTFHRIDEGTTRVMLQLDIEPDGALEKIGDALGFAKRQAEGDLRRFKEFIESRGSASGTWRGNVQRSQ
jgi:uncharacterized membrane protein